MRSGGRVSVWVVLLILAAIATAQAAIPTPPLADDPSLVLRLSFDDKPSLQQKYSWEGSFEGWQIYNPTGNCGSGGFITGAWSTDGSNSLGLDATGQSGSTSCYEPYVYAYVSSSGDYIASFTVDVNVAITGTTGVFKILVNGQEKWNTTSSYTGTVMVNVNANVTEIKFYAAVAAASSDRVTAYIDNMHITFKTKDFSGNGNDGQIYGATATEGRYGYALNFDGNDYVYVGNTQSLNITENITVSAWIKGDTSTWAYVVSKDDRGSQRSWALGVTGGKLWLYAKDANGNTIGGTGSVAIPADEWVFIGFTYDNTTGIATLYVNAQADTTFSGLSGLNPVTEEVRVGSAGNDDKFFTGIIDEVRIYNRSLTADEIKAMYEALRVKFYDESSGEKIAASATIFNTNHLISLQIDEVTKEAVLFNANLPQSGSYWLKVDGDSGIYRQIQVDLGDSLQEVSMWIPTSNVVQIVFNLVDYTGQFSDAILVLKKLIGSNLETIHEDEFDAFGDVSTYLIAGQKYQICVRNSQEERIIGWFVPSTSEEKVLEVKNPMIEQPMWVDVNWVFSFNRTNTSDSIGLIYTDKLGQTTLVRFWVYDMKGNQLYYSESTKSNASLVYTTADVKEAYKAVFEAEHPRYGTISDFKVFRPGAALSTQLFDQIVQSFMPVIASKNLDLAYNLMSCFVLLAVAGLFSYKNRTVGVAVFAGTALLFYWFGFLRIPAIIVATIVVYAALVRIGGGGR